MDEATLNSVLMAALNAAPSEEAAPVDEQVTTDFIDFDMTLFDEVCSQQQQDHEQHHSQQLGDFSSLPANPDFLGFGNLSDVILDPTAASGPAAIPELFVDAPSSLLPSSDPNVNVNAQVSAPAPEDISPWGTLPSEPNVARSTNRHRRITSIGSTGNGPVQPGHRRAASLQTFSQYGLPASSVALPSHIVASSKPPITSGTMTSDPRNVYRPTHRRGQSYGNSMLASSMPVNPTPFHAGHPTLRSNTFPTANNIAHTQPISSTLGLMPGQNWQGQQMSQSYSPNSQLSQQQRAPFPDAGLPSPGTGGGPARRQMGHRRGYSLSQVPTLTADPMFCRANPMSRDLGGNAMLDMAARRQHSMDSLAAGAGTPPVHPRKEALGHRRGASLGHALMTSNLYQNRLPTAVELSAASSGHNIYSAASSLPSAGSAHTSSPFGGQSAPSYRSSHSRSDSISSIASVASYFPSPALNGVSDMDPGVVDTFVGLQLDGTEESNFTEMMNAALASQPHPAASSASANMEHSPPPAQSSSSHTNTNTQTTPSPGVMFEMTMDDFMSHTQQHHEITPMDIHSDMKITLKSSPEHIPVADNTTDSSSSVLAAAAEGAAEDDEEGNEEEEDEEEEEAEDVEHRCMWTNCDLLFGSVEELVSHASDVHVGAGKASYTCQWRGCTRMERPFTKRHKIHNHLRIHTGERPFSCPVADCGKKFSRQDGLNTHIKTHSNVKPYICTFFNCGKAYYHSRSLRKHEKSHYIPTMMSLNLLHHHHHQSALLAAHHHHQQQQQQQQQIIHNHHRHQHLPSMPPPNYTNMVLGPAAEKMYVHHIHPHHQHALHQQQQQQQQQQPAFHPAGGFVGMATAAGGMGMMAATSAAVDVGYDEQRGYTGPTAWMEGRFGGSL